MDKIRYLENQLANAAQRVQESAIEYRHFRQTARMSVDTIDLALDAQARKNNAEDQLSKIENEINWLTNLGEKNGYKNR